MGLPATISRGATVLTLTVPPIVEQRDANRGSARAVAVTLGSVPIVQEWPAASGHTERELHLRIALMSEAQVTTLRTLLDGTGPVTVNLGAGSAITAMFAPIEEQSVEAIVGDYPDIAADGGALADRLKTWKARLSLLRI
jgi:hypothetical protein